MTGRAARNETAPAPASGLILGDFALKGGRVYLRKTGNSAPLDRRLLAEVAIWLLYQAIVRIRSAWRTMLRPPGPAIWFTPDLPHSRYMVRAAARWAGIRTARTAGEADAAFFFEDATRSIPPPAPPGRHFNFGCADISKSRVAAAFETVFGYPLAVDPQNWDGEAVEKSETNGCHDGQVVRCPTAPVAGKAYQRLIHAVDGEGRVIDLRTHCVGGVAVAVWVKRRDIAARFLAPNLSAALLDPASVFSACELALIGRFTEAMGADWCSLDILRDRDGRIYIVDVNKTDAGPIIALPLRAKLASTAILADALLALVARPLAIERGCG